jgi:predicted nucleotidyltransferase
LAEPVDILNPLVAKMLKTMGNVFHDFGVDYYLVGALARDIRLSAHENYAAKRRTKDIDIAVLLDDEKQFYAIKEALTATGHFKESSVKAIKLIYEEAIEVDLLPFGEIETEDRRLELSHHALLSMDMSGFKEVHPFVDTLTLAGGLTLDVCTLEGLVILKLIANEDNPSRTKDITDIGHFIEVYFELCSDEIFSDYMDVMDLYDTGIFEYLQLVSARVIGRKMKNILSGHDKTTEHIKNILDKRPVATWQAMLDGMNDEW